MSVRVVIEFNERETSFNDVASQVWAMGAEEVLPPRPVMPEYVVAVFPSVRTPGLLRAIRDIPGVIDATYDEWRSIDDWRPPIHNCPDCTHR